MARVTAYSPATAALHWASAGTLLGSIGCVVAAQNSGAPETKGRLMFYHKSLGLLTAALLVPRVAAAVLTPRPAAGPSAIGHFLLYCFTASLAATGIAMGYLGGKGLPFFVGTLPGASEPSPDAASASYSLHKMLGRYGKLLIPAHVAGVVAQTARGEEVISRIVTPLISSA